MKIGKVRIIPLDFRRKDRIRYGYLIEQDGKRVLYAPCSIYDAVLDEHYQNLDLLFMEAGWQGNTSLRAKLPKEHAWQSHISFEENLALIKKLKPKRTILTHIVGARQAMVSCWG
jgi:phosphoribosyl 1,2-cyclic phosphodiesterase